MCGVAAIFAYDHAARPVDRCELDRIADHMRARGPDAAGTWLGPDDRIALAHRRLAIIDLDQRAAQPMTSRCGRFVVSFNGEIYNFAALADELRAAGSTLRTTSDTEVLLELFVRDGLACLQHLRGMFAFAIWDQREQVLWLARDTYGIKPLYYADDGRTVRAASQVKALLAGGGVSRDPEPAGIVGFHLWGSVPEPFTLYRAVRAVPAGHVVRIDAAGPHAPLPFQLIEEIMRAAEADPPPQDGVVALRGALLDTVRHHLVADVPVGLFLSAGIDSCAILAALHAIDPDRAAATTAITVTFREYCGRPEDEAPLAAGIASRYGARHITRTVDEAEFHADLPAILAAMDQPSIDGVNTWFVSKAAREHGLKVALSGLGGDELFGGYGSFADLPRWTRWLRAPSSMPGLGRAFRTVARRVGPHLPGWHPKLAGLVEHGGTWPGAYLLRRGLLLPDELGLLLDPDLVTTGLLRLDDQGRLDRLLASGPRTGFGRTALLESARYMRNQLLRDTDWSSMAHSLEVRVPFVDTTLLRAAAPLALTSAGKAILSDAAGLPAAIAGRPKSGFTTPIAAWQQRLVPGKSARIPWARTWSAYVLRRFMDDDPGHVLPANATNDVLPLGAA